MRATRGDLAAIGHRMREERRVVLVVHENPDADAVGAATGMSDLFAQLGVEAALHIGPDVTLPYGDRLTSGVTVVRETPAREIPVYALDCGNRDRIALSLTGWRGFLVNIDHHADNSRFGDLNLVRPESSSTCEVICDLARALDLEPAQQAAAALFAGMSFDSGHFRHPSTGAGTFATAAWLRGLGVDVTAVYGLLYEQRSASALRLWGRALAGARTLVGGRVMLATVSRDDYLATGADEGETEGIVESLRSVAGVEVAALIRAQMRDSRTRVSLRSDELDVSAVAALKGGGGHRLAAGFTSDETPEEVTAWLSSELARRLSTASC